MNNPLMTPDIIKAAYTVVAARALANIETRKDNEIERMLLGRDALYTSARWAEGRRSMPVHRIEDPDEIFLADHDEMVAFHQRKAAVTGRKDGGSDALDAQNAQAQAEHALVDLALAVVAKEPRMAGLPVLTADRLLNLGINEYQETIEMILKLVIPAAEKARRRGARRSA